MSIDLGLVFRKMVDFDPDRFRVNHLLKVDGYAEMIGRAEDMDEEDLLWLRVAAILHDIGIKPSLEIHGSSDGHHQQIEGPPAARALLEGLSAPVERIDRVCWLIARHHQYSSITGLDYQILVEADFLVNCDEGAMARNDVVAIRNNVFKTEPGIDLLNRLFQL